jgi:general nucleoside transport system permease protein
LSASRQATPVSDAPVPDAHVPRRRSPWLGVRVERRPEPRLIGLYRVAAMVLGLSVALLLAPLLGPTPASEFYDLAFSGTFGTALGFSNVLVVAIPLAIAGLAASLPYRLGLWNIGIDGQVLIGAWMAFGLSRVFTELAAPLLIPLMMLAGMLGGALWILGPALARAYLGLNEIIVTFLLNFVAIAWTTYWVTGPWVDPVGGGGVRSEPLPTALELGSVNIGSVTTHWGIILAVALPIAAWLTVRLTRLGHEITVIGASERAAEYSGINVRRRIAGVMLAGGALGGVAGVVDMLGTLHQLAPSLGTIGFSAVVIAVLAGGSEPAVLVMAFVFAVLLVGGDSVGLAGVSPDLVFAMIGTTLLFAVAGDALARFRVIRTRQLGQYLHARPVAAPDAPAGSAEFSSRKDSDA